MVSRASQSIELLVCVPMMLALSGVAGCTCTEDKSQTSAVPPAPPPILPAVTPVPPPTLDPNAPLEPAETPVLGVAIPVGFVKEPLAIPEAAGKSIPWVHVRGRVPIEKVAEFYQRYLDPGTPAPLTGARAPMAPGGEAVRCRVTAGRPKPGCRGTPAQCIERVCTERAEQVFLFSDQRPKPPGNPAALVNVHLQPFGGEVRITIESETLLQILREHEEAREMPPQPDLTGYERFEDIPREFIE